MTETIIKVKEYSYNVQIDEMDKNDMIAWQKILQERVNYRNCIFLFKGGYAKE